MNFTKSLFILLVGYSLTSATVNCAYMGKYAFSRTASTIDTSLEFTIFEYDSTTGFVSGQHTFLSGQSSDCPISSASSQYRTHPLFSYKPFISNGSIFIVENDSIFFVYSDMPTNSGFPGLSEEFQTIWHALPSAGSSCQIKRTDIEYSCKIDSTATIFSGIASNDLSRFTCTTVDTIVRGLHAGDRILILVRYGYESCMDAGLRVSFIAKDTVYRWLPSSDLSFRTSFVFYDAASSDSVRVRLSAGAGIGHEAWLKVSGAWLFNIGQLSSTTSLLKPTKSDSDAQHGSPIAGSQEFDLLGRTLRTEVRRPATIVANDRKAIAVHEVQRIPQK